MHGDRVDASAANQQARGEVDGADEHLEFALIEIERRKPGARRGPGLEQGCEARRERRVAGDAAKRMHAEFFGPRRSADHARNHRRLFVLEAALQVAHERIAVFGQFGLQPDVHRTFTAHAKAPNGVVRLARIEPSAFRASALEHAPRALVQVRFEAAAADHAARAPVRGDKNPRTGLAVGRPFGTQHGGEHQRLAAALGSAEKSANFAQRMIQAVILAELLARLPADRLKFRVI